jgi:hypothetical protein
VKGARAALFKADGEKERGEGVRYGVAPRNREVGEGPRPSGRRLSSARPRRVRTRGVLSASKQGRLSIGGLLGVCYGPSLVNSAVFYLFKIFQTNLNLVRSKEVLLELQKIKVIYVFVAFELRNTFPY